MIRAIVVLATTIPLLSPIILRNNIFCDVRIFPMLAGDTYTIDFTYLLTPGESATITIEHTYSKRTREVYSKSFVSTGPLHDSFVITLDEKVISNSINMQAQSEKHGTNSYEFNLNVSEKLPSIDFSESHVFNNTDALIEIDKDGRLRKFYENIIFKNFYKYFELSSSLYFDITELEITYDSNYYYAISEHATARLGLDDVDNLFPRLSESSTYRAKMLELEIIEEEIGYLKFAFKNKLYVDKTTRMMSLTKEDGFMETTKFYFPVNRHSDVDGLKFFIHFENFGILKQDFVYSSTYKPIKKVVGDCLTSNYCLTTNETDFDDSLVESMVLTRD